jgi:hypothetical protein
MFSVGHFSETDFASGFLCQKKIDDCDSRPLFELNRDERGQ